MFKVLSLFDGISGARQALKNLDINCKYYAAEIDKFAIQIAKSNHSDIIHIGNVKGIEFEDGYIFYNQNNDPIKNGGSLENKIDLLIGGSPCQDLSCAKRGGKGLEGEKSSLFYEYVRILKKVKPKYFILENVASMKKEAKQKISEELFGIEPIMIDSALLTAQSRKRVYWVGKLINDKYEQVKIDQPKDKGILLKDILESGDTEKLKAYCITATYSRACPQDYFNHGQRQLVFVYSPYNDKINRDYKSYSLGTNPQCLTSVAGQIVRIKDILRKLTPTECCRLQGFPDDYVNMVSKTQAYKALGNSFTVPVIKYILKNVL